MLEAAILLIPLVLLVAGLIDAGYVLKRSNTALMASQAAARAESVTLDHGLNMVLPPSACIDATCAPNSCNSSSFPTAHAAACAYLSQDIGNRYDPLDWLVSVQPSELLNSEIGMPNGGSDRPYYAATVTVKLNPQRSSPCIICFMGAFSKAGVRGDSTFLLHR